MREKKDEEAQQTNHTGHPQMNSCRNLSIVTAFIFALMANKDVIKSSHTPPSARMIDR